jgi:hypothetical protein
MGAMSRRSGDHDPATAGRTAPSTELPREFEYRVLTLPRETSRSEARRLLAAQAEYGHWEIARVRAYAGGTRRVWLRRRIIRVVRTA